MEWGDECRDVTKEIQRSSRHPDSREFQGVCKVRPEVRPSRPQLRVSCCKACVSKREEEEGFQRFQCSISSVSQDTRTDFHINRRSARLKYARNRTQFAQVPISRDCVMLSGSAHSKGDKEHRKEPGHRPV